MKRDVTFNKEINGMWFISLPDWEGDKSELQMISGADTLLDRLTKDGVSVSMEISDQVFDGAQKMVYDEYGFYQYKNQTIWLCPVTEFVFDGGYPAIIYFKQTS